MKIFKMDALLLIPWRDSKDIIGDVNRTSSTSRWLEARGCWSSWNQQDRLQRPRSSLWGSSSSVDGSASGNLKKWGGKPGDLVQHSKDWLSSPLSTRIWPQPCPLPMPEAACRESILTISKVFLPGTTMAPDQLTWSTAGATQSPAQVMYLSELGLKYFIHLFYFLSL